MFDSLIVLLGQLLSFLTIIGGLAACAYLFLPLVIYATFKFYVPTEILFFDPQELQLPEQVRGYTEEQTNQLAALGFRPVANFALPKLLSNVKSLNVLFVNEREGDSAMISAIWAQAQVTELKVCYVEFVRRFARGGCLQVSNSKAIGAFRSPENDHTYQFWDIQDLSKLYGLHRQIALALNYGPARISLIHDFHGDVEAFLQKKVIEAPAVYQEQVGLFRRIDGGYGLTIKGAYLLTWRELFPIKQALRWRVRRAALKWL